MLDSIEEVLVEIKASRMIVVVDDEDCENEGVLLMADSRPEFRKQAGFFHRYGRSQRCPHRYFGF
jgi:3,4-dihydroxy 2-butanone 4-phosphate synthase/GTP cyclohydrolase II